MGHYGEKSTKIFKWHEIFFTNFAKRPSSWFMIGTEIVVDDSGSGWTVPCGTSDWSEGFTVSGTRGSSTSSVVFIGEHGWS